MSGCSIERPNVYLVWLEWPEKCFRVDAEALRFLKTRVPAGSRVVRVRGEAAFLRALPRATHAVVWNFKPEWFARAPRLRMLATPAAGQEFVPTKGPKGVRIHFGHFHGKFIAESVAAFMLAWARGFFAVGQAPAAVRDWPRTWLSDRCAMVGGSQAVLVGFGNVGRAIGEMLERLGVAVTGITRHGVFKGARRPRRTDPAWAKRALGQADWLVLALPSTTGTDDYLDAKLIRRLPRKCVVINVGRGNSVDEKALCAALGTKRLAGAYLDVRKHEPSATVLETAGYVPELADLPNCISMPHSSAFADSYLLDCFRELEHDRCL